MSSPSWFRPGATLGFYPERLEAPEHFAARALRALRGFASERELCRRDGLARFVAAVHERPSFKALIEEERPMFGSNA